MADLTSTNIYGNLNVTGSGYVYGDQLYSESVISINKYSCKMVIESEGFGTGNAVDLCIPIGTSYVNFRLISLKVGHGGSSVDPEGFIEKHYSGRSYNNTLYNYVSKVIFNPVREVYAGEFSVVNGVLKVPLTHNQVNNRNLVVYLDCFGDERFINAVKEAYFSDIYVLAWPGGQYETIPERLGIGLGTAGVPNCALEISNNGVLKISGGSAPDWPTGSGLGPELAANTNFAGVGTTGISTLMSYDRTALAYKDMYYNAYSHVFTTSSLSSIKMYLSNSGNLGIGKTDPAYKLDIVGDIRLTSQIISTLADGTAPFSITSTTMNTNLNADMVDGYHASDLALVPSSGTINYLAKWTGVNSLGNSVVYDNGTNVGIGTSEPASELDVSGTTRLNTTLWGDENASSHFKYLHTQKVLTVSFPNSVANQNVDIYWPADTAMRFSGELILNSAWTNSNCFGYFKKEYAFGGSSTGAVYRNYSQITSNLPAFSTYFHVGDIEWDSVNSRWKITISSLTSAGNFVSIVLRGSAVTTEHTNILSQAKISDIYIEDKGLTPQDGVYFNSMLSIDAMSNTKGLRIYGSDETDEILDIYVGPNGNGIFKLNTNTNSFFDFRPNHSSNYYGILLRQNGDTDDWGKWLVSETYMNFAKNSLSSTDGLVINDSNYVGVNRVPAYGLDVNGTARIDASTLATTVPSHVMVQSGSDNVLKWQSWSDFSTNISTSIGLDDYLPLAGGTMSGDINMGVNSITNALKIEANNYTFMTGPNNYWKLGDLSNTARVPLWCEDNIIFQVGVVLNKNYGSLQMERAYTLAYPNYSFITDTNTGIAGGITADEFSLIAGGSEKVTIHTNGMDVLGELDVSGQIISNLAVGTAPFSITSTTMSPNLNADMVDGYHASDLALVPSSGTTNYLAKWTGVNSLGDSVIYDNGTNIAIGHSSPAAPLDISGRVYQRGLGASTFFGYEAGKNDDLTNNYNSAMGFQSLYSNTTGYYNSAMGYQSLYSNTKGYRNSAMGMYSLYRNTTGNYNSAMGYQSLYSNTTGNNNSAMGYASLRNNSTGSNNSAMGYQAGRYIAGGVVENTTPSQSVYLGANTKALAADDTNEIVIGYDATGIGSNSVVLGNDSITKTALKGDVGIGTISPSEKLSIYSGNMIIDAYGEGPGSGIFFRDSFSPNGINNTESNQRNVSIRVRGLDTPENPDGLEINGQDGIIFGTGSTDSVVIDSNGNVGINTTNPQYGMLEVKPSTADANHGITLYTGSGNTARSWIDGSDKWIMSRGADGTRGITITPSPYNVGIGDTDPAYKLEVAGDTNITSTSYRYRIAGTSLNVVAGNGLITGGDLDPSATLTLGKPSTLTASTTNAVTSTSHTHAITGFSPTTHNHGTGTVNYVPKWTSTTTLGNSIIKDNGTSVNIENTSSDSIGFSLSGLIHSYGGYVVRDTYYGKTFTMTYISAVSINLYKTSTPYGNLVYDASLSVTTKQADIRGGIVVSGSAG